MVSLRWKLLTSGASRDLQLISFQFRVPELGSQVYTSMALLVADKLIVNTDIGECSIELCHGDITKLPKDEAVDVLVVSAFPGEPVVFCGRL